ncbi:MAG: lactate racemase domain-containing protein [Verrucomicrobiota bacterium]
MPWFTREAPTLTRAEIEPLCQRLLDEAQTRLGCDLRRVLLLPPDLTRAHSGAGWITETLYRLLPEGCEAHVIPTLGQHRPHTPEENRWMFGSIPQERIHEHPWRDGCTVVGEVPAEVVHGITGGRVDFPLPVHINRMLMEEKWDLIINVGHVVPHEVLGFANHNKNYFIGLGGKDTMCAAHMCSATIGIENNLGRLVSKTREIFNWAEDEFLSHLPDVFLQIVMGRDEAGGLVTTGIYVGDDRDTYLEAARASQRQNITLLEKPIRKIVAHMQADEFRRTWVANKAVYRTRLALADGGELLVIAPGVDGFGEQPEVDRIIRRYGYDTTPNVLAAYEKDPLLRDFANGTAHLMNGSSEGRFTIRYATKGISRQEIESVHYQYADLEETLARYPLDQLQEGFNTMPDGEEIYFIQTPSAGLWATREKMDARGE